MSHKSAQLSFRFERRGGKRVGAGRKPKDPSLRAGPGVSHLRRPQLSPRYPVHVTLKLRAELKSLRRGKTFRVVRDAFWALKALAAFRLVHYSVQGNHLHLMIEAESNATLAKGLQGLSIRIARGLNRLLGRSGAVFSDRYHARVLKTPTEVRNALRYVLMNLHHHLLERGEGELPATWFDLFSSAIALEGWRFPTLPMLGELPLSEPRSWLLAVGWKKAGRFLDADGLYVGRPRLMMNRCATAPHASACAGTSAATSTSAATMNVFRMLVY